jgi:hypothetical protein
MNRKIAVFFLNAFLTLTVTGVFAQTGVIKELSGTVEFKAGGAQNFTVAKIGDRISQDTVISTGFKSSALVEAGSAIITVRPLACLTLKEISSSANSETLRVNLRAGRVRAELNPPAGTKASMSVSSPVATASVRGTKFEFDTRNLYVERGSVAFSGNRGGLTLVKTGYMGSLDNSNKAHDPIDTMNSGLLPRAPAGAELTGGDNSKTQTRPEATITITPVYNYQ